MLRVGVMLDSKESYAWIADVLQRIEQSEFASLAVVALRSTDVTGGPTRRASMLFRHYERWDHIRNKAEPDALAAVDVASTMPGVRRIFINPQSQDAQISQFDLDVLIWFGRDEPAAQLSDSARYGVWYPRVSGGHDFPDASCFWPMFNQMPVTDCVLMVRRSAVDSPQVLYSSPSATDHSSLQANRNPVFWKAAAITMRCLQELNDFGAAFLDRFLQSEAPASKDGKLSPSNTQMIAFGCRFLGNWLKTRVAGLSSNVQPKWYIGIRNRSTELGFDDAAGYTLLPCPRDRFYADPFLYDRNGRTFLFFEDFRYSLDRARISFCEILPDGTCTEAAEALNPPFHLSYPFVFEDDGVVYMIPESRSRKNVVLYRADDFPGTWSPDAVLLENVHAVDTTIYKNNGKYWMFAGTSDGRYSNSDELSIFFSDTLRGPWTPHPSNPVVSDVRRARPAGKLFVESGKLIRPSQDCSKAYGYGLVFSEIIKLTETEYEERPVSRIYPESIPGVTRNHTYNRTERCEVVDRFIGGKAIRNFPFTSVRALNGYAMEPVATTTET